MAHTVERIIWRKGFGPKQVAKSETLHRQLGIATQFATFSASNDDLHTLQHEVCRAAAEGLGVTFAKLLVYRADECAFVMEAGVGWGPGFVGTARLDADMGTAAGFAWHSGHAVISNDLLYDRRFRTPAILTDHAIIRSVNVVVPGTMEAAFGVLEVESPDLGNFTEHDVSFLQLLAHSLASAITRIMLRTRYDEEAARSRLDHHVSLHELQHRVRNDFQVIYSVVAIEARRTTDPAGKTGFGRVGDRVLALAELYHHLLIQQQIDEVDLGAYLRSLCDKIAYAAELSARGIMLNAETDRLMMSLDRAVKLAVAVNELVANAAKHAFPDNTSGRITIELAAKDTDDGAPVVRIADNGCGFESPRPGGVGLTYVKQLIHQAGGVLEREDGEGTRWRIRLHS
jgi:two-component sensor histidine kinase/putative methionine-R-sulfoxide reductase with GAF domain